MSKAVFAANHLTDTKKQKSAEKYTNKYNSKKQTKHNTAKSKLHVPWFSRLVPHSARKRDGLILHRCWAHTGRVLVNSWISNVMANRLHDSVTHVNRRNMHALFLVCSLRADSVITSKTTWKLKHGCSILEYFEYFCQITSKSILIILSYTVSKLDGLFLRRNVGPYTESLSVINACCC